MKTIILLLVWSIVATSADGGDDITHEIPVQKGIFLKKEVISIRSESQEIDKRKSAKGGKDTLGIKSTLSKTKQTPDSNDKNKQTRIDFRSCYLLAKKGKFYLDFGLIPSIAGRKLRIAKAPFPDYPGFDVREQNEYTIFGLSGELKVGFGLSKNSSLYFSYIFQNQGFRTTGHTVDWKTGLADPNSSGNYRYSFRNNGLAIGFSRNPFERINNVTADMGFYFVQISPISDAAKKDQFARKLVWGSIISIGYKRAVSNHLDLRIMPTLYTNFTHINHEGLVNTRLFNVGITGGLRWYL